MDGGELGPAGWVTDKGNIVCNRCGAIDVVSSIFARDLVAGSECVRCHSVWQHGSWYGRSVLQQMYESLQMGPGDMWNDETKKLEPVDDETAAKADPNIVFRVEEIVEVKGLRFAVEQIRGRRLTLRPLGRRL